MLKLCVGKNDKTSVVTCVTPHANLGHVLVVGSGSGGVGPGSAGEHGFLHELRHGQTLADQSLGPTPQEEGEAEARGARVLLVHEVHRRPQTHLAGGIHLALTGNIAEVSQG